MSLMLKHQQKHPKATPKRAAARHAVIGSGAAGMIGRQQLNALLDNALEEDLRGLKTIKSVERKIEVKRAQLLPKYRDYVARLRGADQAHDLLGFYMVWLFDAGEIEAALDLGFYMAEMGFSLPERFNRDVSTFLADAVLEWADAEYEAERSPEPYFSTLFAHVDGSDDTPAWDLPDALRAKYYRLRGLLDERAGNIEAAVGHLEHAMALGAKVKTKLNDLKRLQDKEGE